MITHHEYELKYSQKPKHSHHTHSRPAAMLKISQPGNFNSSSSSSLLNHNSICHQVYSRQSPINNRTYVDEEWNDQHDEHQFNLRILERRQDELLHVVPEVHLNKQGRNQLDNCHQTHVDPCLVDPRLWSACN